MSDNECENCGVYDCSDCERCDQCDTFDCDEQCEQCDNCDEWNCRKCERCGNCSEWNCEECEQCNNCDEWNCEDCVRCDNCESYECSGECRRCRSCGSRECGGCCRHCQSKWCIDEICRYCRFCNSTSCANYECQNCKSCGSNACGGECMIVREPTYSELAKNNPINKLLMGDSECPISVEEIKENDVYMTCRTCRYNFHRDAMVEWLDEDMSCPNCRSKWTGTDEFINIVVKIVDATEVTKLLKITFNK